MSKFKPGELVQTLVMSKRRGSQYWLPATVINQMAKEAYNLEIVKEVAEHYMVAKDRKRVHLKEIRPLPKLHVGDRVRVDLNKNGYIRWIGSDKAFGNSEHVQYGIQLDNARGFSDGTWRGKRFFLCNRWCGVFIKERERITLLKSSQPNSTSTLVSKGAVPKSAKKGGPSGKLLNFTDSVVDDEKGNAGNPGFISPRLQTEEEKEIRMTFKFFDTNKDQKIDSKELKKVMKQLGSEIDDAGVELLVEYFDLNKNGTIEWEEFLKMMKAIGGVVS